MRYHKLTIFVVLASLFMLTACGNNSSSSNSNRYHVDDDANAFEEAVSIYKMSCIACHATDLEGRIGPKTDLSQVGNRLSKDEIIDVIMNGRDVIPNMPSFSEQLTEDEIEALADWLSQKK